MAFFFLKLAFSSDKPFKYFPGVKWKSKFKSSKLSSWVKTEAPRREGGPDRT